MMSGTLGLVVSPSFPDDSIQNFCPPWWQKEKGGAIARGRLVWAFVPHVDQQPYVLAVKGRVEDDSHSDAEFEVQPLRVNNPPEEAFLPVAALPSYPGEVRTVYRAKRRPALVVAEPGIPVEKALRRGVARYQTNRCFLIAPYYGADRGGKRGGWRPEFVQRIRRAEYPQYMWDRLPIGGANESILRVDHIQPIGAHNEAVRPTSYGLTADALEILDEWLTWFLKNRLAKDGVLSFLREELKKL